MRRWVERAMVVLVLSMRGRDGGQVKLGIGRMKRKTLHGDFFGRFSAVWKEDPGEKKVYASAESRFSAGQEKKGDEVAEMGFRWRRG